MSTIQSPPLPAPPDPAPAVPVPTAPETLGPRTLGHRVSSFFYRHPRLRLALVLSVPLTWFIVIYLGSLGALLLTSFHSLDSFSGTVDTTLTLDTWRSLWSAITRDIVMRTVIMAALVTVGAAMIALPVGYFMARVATPRAKALLFVLVLMPLWSSYIVRVLSWRQILNAQGVITWFTDLLGLTWLVDAVLRAPLIGGADLTTSFAGQYVVFLYIWLPYMILPVQAALERVPPSVLEASSDLGARPLTTFRRVTWPLGLPGIVAGSIFTFSLTLGDYIIPQLVGPSKPTIGLAIYQFQGVAGNLPLAAAYTAIPMAIMAVYLTVARRLGAFEAL
jgi:putative spermidine/putrescine transport system permease protein